MSEPEADIEKSVYDLLENLTDADGVLGSDPDESDPPTPTPTPAETPAPAPTPAKATEGELIAAPAEEPPMAPTTEITVNQIPPLSAEHAKYFKQYDQVAEDVLLSCKTDRQSAENLLDICMAAIRQHGNQCPRMFVDAAAKTLEVKANVNMNAIKIIEAAAKLLAATKAGTNVSVQNNTINSTGLQDVLQASPFDPDAP